MRLPDPALTTPTTPTTLIPTDPAATAARWRAAVLCAALISAPALGWAQQERHDRGRHSHPGATRDAGPSRDHFRANSSWREADRRESMPSPRPMRDSTRPMRDSPQPATRFRPMPEPRTPVAPRPSMRPNREPLPTRSAIAPGTTSVTDTQPRRPAAVTPVHRPARAPENVFRPAPSRIGPASRDVSRPASRTDFAPRPSIDMHHARPGFQPPANTPTERHRWELDARHGHAHFYPSPGYPVTALPHGHRSVRYSGRRYYFYSGIWYQPTWYGYTVIRPPLGLVLPILPLYYSIVWFGGVRYYYANDVYYLLDPDGYRVVAPPTGAPTLVEQPPSAAATDAGPFSEGTWYYCQSSGAYYPHVSECSVSWQPVPAAPPAASILPGQTRYGQGTWYWCDTSASYYPYATECASGWRTTPASPPPR